MGKWYTGGPEEKTSSPHKWYVGDDEPTPKHKVPLNGRGNAMVAAPLLAFPIAEAIFHANPVVGGIVAALAGTVAYRHYDDVKRGVGNIAKETVRTSHQVQKKQDKVFQPSSSYSGESQISDEYDMLSISDDRQFAADDIIGNRSLIVGLPGSGKTNLVANICQGLGELDVPMLIIDYKQDYISLADCMPNCIIFNNDNVGVASPDKLAAMIFEENLKIIVDLCGRDNLDEGYMDACLIVQALQKWGRSHPDDRRPCAVVIDEAQLFFPQDGNSVLGSDVYKKCLSIIAGCVSGGRSLGPFTIIAGQRLAQIDKKICGIRDICFLFRQSSEQDLKAYSAIVDIKAFDFPSLVPGDCVFVDARGKGQQIYTFIRKSEDHSYTPKLAHSRRRISKHDYYEDAAEQSDESETRRLPETPVRKANGVKSTDIPDEALIAVWNKDATYRSVKGLESAFGCTNHQAQLMYKRIQKLSESI